MRISFVHYGIPRAKARPRPRFGGKGYFIPTGDYEKDVAKSAGVVMAGRDPIPAGVPVWVRLVFYMPIAKSWTKKKKAEALAGTIRPTSKPDIDNMEKSVLDAMNEVVFHDDAQIVGKGTKLLYAEQPRVEVDVGVVEVENDQ